MTSSANQQNTSAPIPTIATSYASAAGANKKPAAATPVIATGSQPAVVVSSNNGPSQHARTSSASPMNGNKPTIMPVVPNVAAAPVAHGNTNLNGNSADHSRKSSVTMSAAASNNFIANGGPVGGGPKQPHIPQFGFKESPAVAHSTPQQMSSAPMQIPGNHPMRIPSPAHSPSPIPQHATSGGRPPSTIPQEPSNMKFGSLGGDGERHMKQHLQTASQGSIPNSPNTRRDSFHSQHGDMANHGRGGFQPQGGRGGRGGGNFNNQQYHSPGMPYGRPYQGPNGQGRGAMQNFGQRPGGQMHYSPQPHRASPAMAHAMPSATGAHMGGPPALPPQQQAFGYQQPPMGYGAPMNGMPQAYAPGYPGPHFDPRGGPQQMGMYPYNVPPQQFMPQPNQSPSPAFNTPYTNSQYPTPMAQPMSRNASQASERPASSTGGPQLPPAIVSGSQPTPKATVGKPRRSAAIQIKRPDGEVVDTSNIVKTPASPVPPTMQSKTPPVVASTPTPTPPPKSATPSHLRNESTSTSKSAEQLRKEFQEQVRKTAGAPATESTDAASADEQAPSPSKKVEEKPTEVETKAVEAEPKSEEAAPKAEEVSKPEVTQETKVEEPAAAAADSHGQRPGETEDEYMDRMIAEMEEEDKKREAEQEKKSAEIAARKAEEKKKQDADRAVNAAEADRKLREQEREMERLEEEKERKAKEREAGGSGLTVADALKAKISDLSVKDKAPASPDAVAAKLADLKIGGKDTTPAESLAKSGEKQRTKPSALNLAPLNTKAVEPPQPTAQQNSLRTARFLSTVEASVYPDGILSPNPSINQSAASKRGNFRYDTNFLLQFKGVFVDKPSVDFDQQVKALMGDSNDGSRSARTPGTARQNSRTPGGFPSTGGMMGSFGANKTLPPGTTSDQRFAMSQGTLPRPASQIGSFGRPGGFPGPTSMSRNPSTTNMGGMPSSPRQGSRNTRGGSRRHDFKDTKAEAQAAKAMPLTAGMDLKPIAVTSTGWKPMSLAKTSAMGPPAGGAGPQLLDPPMVQRKVKAALNKMTPEKFDKISEQILDIALQSRNEDDGRTLRQVIQLTFEKATDEAHWAPMYAKFCRRMLEMMSPEIRDSNVKDKNGNVVSGGALFRKYLLNRCQEEFERGWKLDLPKPKEGESKAGEPKEAALLSDEYYEEAAAKRRGLGLVQFIGELFKLGMLTERIMHQCITKLVDYQSTPDEAEVESLSKLLRTVGASLDNIQGEKGQSSRGMMDAYFERIQNMIAIPDLPSRLQFMLMDVVDLRRQNWISKDTNKGPKTLDEIRADAEAAAAQKAAEAARSSQRGGGGRGGMPMGGRGDARGGYPPYQQQTSNHVGMDDLRRLKGGAGRTSSSTISLGPTSMFASRSNSGRRGLGPGGVLGRAGEESGASSRTGTPPTQASANAFHILSQMDSADNPASPPSTAASPALTKAVPDASGSSKKD